MLDEEKKRLFEHCVADHHAAMYRVALRLTGCTNAARDLVQEAYLQAWSGLEGLRDPQRMTSWLFAILRNQHLKRVRREGRNRPLREQDLQNLSDHHPASSRTYSGTVPQETIDQVQTAVEQLDDDHKWPLLLHVMEELSVQEVATALELPPGTVMSRLHRARKKLKAIIERQIIADDAQRKP